MAIGDKLKTTPLVEALCEFRFAPASNWDWTVPGRLFDLIKGEFSDRAQVHAVGFQVNVAGGRPEASLISSPDRVQLKRPNGSAMVQVGPDLLSINQLRPYESWELFRPMILRVLAECLKVVGSPKLSRVGLRYINQLPISDLARVSEMITVVPDRKRALSKPFRGFYQRYELALDRPRGVLIHQTGFLKTPEGDRLMIDLDVGSEDTLPDVASPQDVQGWLDAAHDRIEESFVETLTPEKYESLRTGK